MTRHDKLVILGIVLAVASATVLHTAYGSRPMPLAVKLLGLVA